MNPNKLTIDDSMLRQHEGPTARISHETHISLWKAAATAVNSIKADALREVAAELRAEASDYPDGHAAFVDASWLDSRAHQLELGGDTQ